MQCRVMSRDSLVQFRWTAQCHNKSQVREIG